MSTETVYTRNEKRSIVDINIEIVKNFTEKRKFKNKNFKKNAIHNSNNNNNNNNQKVTDEFNNNNNLYFEKDVTFKQKIIVEMQVYEDEMQVYRDANFLTRILCNS